VSASTERQAVASCTQNGKCEYQCDAGYREQAGSCALDPNATDICEATDGARCYYVAPNGIDANDGSIGAPFASTNPVIDSLGPGDFVYFRGGEYGETAKADRRREPLHPFYYAVAYVRRSGTPGRPITFGAIQRAPVLTSPSIGVRPDLPDDAPEDAFHPWMAAHRDPGFGSGTLHRGEDPTTPGSRTTTSTTCSTTGTTTAQDAMSARYAYVRNNDPHVLPTIPTTPAAVLNTTRWLRRPAQRMHHHHVRRHLRRLRQRLGALRVTGNDIHDCPVHSSSRTSGEMVNEDKVNLLVKDNRFHGRRLAIWFES
jgi:hypothetical protein